MKCWYNQEDIKNGNSNEIPLNTKVIIKTRSGVVGRLMINDKSTIAIDEPKKLGGTYFNNDGIELIKIIENTFNKLVMKKDDTEINNLMFFNPSNFKTLNYKDLDGKTLKMTVVDNDECLLVVGVDKENNTIYMLHSEVK